MQTRAAAKRATEAAKAHVEVKESDPHLDGPKKGAADHEVTIPTTSPGFTVQTQVTTTTARSDVASNKPKDIVSSAIGAETLVSSTTSRKRGRKTPIVPVRGGWDVLPHNLGQLWAHKDVADEEEPSAANGNLYEDAADTPLKKRLRSARASSSNDVVPAHVSHAQQPQTGAEEQEVKEQLEQQSPAKTEKKTPKRKARKTKGNPYGLTPGETPYPDWQSPNPEQCEAVYRILADMHDDIQPLPPQKIPAPSLEVAGCGEVPCVLDGLIRTVLSGSTTFDMADKMLQALVDKFGISEEGTGAGSVNWNNIRIADYDDVYHQLKPGGLGANKAKNIQAILGMVYEENMQRRAAYIEEQETGKEADVLCASSKTKGQKDLEILRADQKKLNLDFMHDMTKDEALHHFVRYPGVGVKTAACVTLFSLQRPCFAVDTHVFRMSRWLGWVPQKTNEDDTFRHLEVRCPDHLKYGLHQLFIRHGKTCYRCNDKSFKGTEAWDGSVCPLEHLLNRFSKRQAKPKELMKPEKQGEALDKKSKTGGRGRPKSQDMKISTTNDDDTNKAGAEETSEDQDIDDGDGSIVMNANMAPQGAEHKSNGNGNQTEDESELSELDSSDIDAESLQA
ncbi:amidophosphoribosyltransferase [Apiospora rasikravindrae]|uniref:Amidophosphoribosyltransferase n=1 Tax=Apiospora rasikravindrae TaxID=990691 RepID=A0ABR1T6W2_9PEZI